jgi:roadblock/LC7 domain-containing protein
MSIIMELAATPGVIAAGEYSYRGDRFSFQGQLDEEKARMASIMCRATTMAVHMQTNILKSLAADCGCAPARGWIVRGQQFSVCVIANVFCFIDNSAASLNDIMAFMREHVTGQEGELI